MKNYILKGLSRIFVTLALSVFVCCAVYAEDGEPMISAVDALPPVTVVEDRAPEYGCRVGADIDFFENGDGYYLFLPSSAKLNEVLVRYDGGLQLYDPSDGQLYGSGSLVRLDFTGEKNYIYEYNAESNLYLRYPIKVMAGGSIPAMFITLDEGNSALRKLNTSKSFTVTGSLVMAESSGRVVYSGDLTKMKGHGNTSYIASGSANTKNSYNINLGSKAELISGAGKSKKWTMLRIRTWDNYDPTGVSYLVGFYTFNALVGDGYANTSARYTDVYINGEYRGVYVLTERMDEHGAIEVTDLEGVTSYSGDSFKGVSGTKTDPAIAAGISIYSYCSSAECPEDTDITGGYVLEVNCGTYGECGFKTKNGMFVGIKSPSHPTKEQVQYIAEYVQSFENALFSDTGYNSLGKHYTEYIDMPSFAAQNLAYAYYLNWEIYRTSTYIYKDADGCEHDTLTFGPVWDFESGANVMENDKTLLGSTFSYTERQQYVWYEQFWKKADYIYYLDGMNSEMRRVIDTLMGKTESNYIFSLNDMLKSVEPSQDMNWVRWGERGSFSEYALRMKKGLNSRYTCWFDELWNGENYLLGAYVTSEKVDGGVLLSAICKDAAESYQWYRVDEDDLTSYTPIDGANESSYLATDGGIYICGVSGKCNAYWKYASGKVFRKADIEMFTSPVSADESAELDIIMPEEYKLGEEPEDTAGMPEIPGYVSYIRTEETAEETDETENEPAELSESVTGESDKPYIIAAVIVFAAVAVAVIIVYLTDRRGRKNA